MESSATNPSIKKQDVKVTIDSILNTYTPTVLTHHPNTKSIKKLLDDHQENFDKNRQVHN